MSKNENLAYELYDLRIYDIGTLNETVTIILL